MILLDYRIQFGDNLEVIHFKTKQYGASKNLEKRIPQNPTKMEQQYTDLNLKQSFGVGVCSPSYSWKLHGHYFTNVPRLPTLYESQIWNDTKVNSVLSY